MVEKTKKPALLLTTVAAWFSTAAYAVSPIDLIPDILTLGIVLKVLQNIQ